ncbi:MAG: SigE family RNA polymerase sigma factor [Acidimicrobiia bacterium]|nr:SigE family RNA polymerase sigma factor [Acidimicrobiia bacterium]
MSAPKRRGCPRGRDTQDDLLVRLFADHYKDLVRLASLLLDDVGSCEEVVQDAFVKLHTLSARPEAGKEAAYLRSMVLNGARSRMRKRMVRQRVALAPVPPASSAEEGALERLGGEALLDAVRSLPRRQSEVLTLRYYLDLSEAEIAGTLGISPGSVKTHASRGLAALERKLTASGANEATS